MFFGVLLPFSCFLSPFPAPFFFFSRRSGFGGWRMSFSSSFRAHLPVSFFPRFSLPCSSRTPSLACLSPLVAERRRGNSRCGHFKSSPPGVFSHFFCPCRFVRSRTRIVCDPAFPPPPHPCALFCVFGRPPLGVFPAHGFLFFLCDCKESFPLSFLRSSFRFFFCGALWI